MILVTGCLGFIGSNLCEELVKREKVLGLDLFKNKKEIEKKFPFTKSKNFTLIKADITNQKELAWVFEEHRVEKVIHLAAKSQPRSTNTRTSEYLRINIFGTLNLLEECIKKRIKQFVFISTSYVYGKAKPPFNEEKSPCNPLSIYGITKRSAETLCHSYSLAYRIPTTCLRLFTVYGEGGRRDMAVGKFTKLISNGKTIPKFGDGKSKRDYVYVGDVIKAILKSLEHPFSFEIINIGTGKATSINKLIQLIERTSGKKAVVKSVPEPLSEPPITLADISKAKALLGWEPRVPIEDGIRRVLENKGN